MEKPYHVVAVAFLGGEDRNEVCVNVPRLNGKWRLPFWATGNRNYAPKAEIYRADDAVVALPATEDRNSVTLISRNRRFV